jgi:hypothetical protein
MIRKRIGDETASMRSVRARGVTLGSVFLDVPCREEALEMHAEMTFERDELTVRALARFSAGDLARRTSNDESFREDRFGLDHLAKLTTTATAWPRG